MQQSRKGNNKAKKSKQPKQKQNAQPKISRPTAPVAVGVKARVPTPKFTPLSKGRVRVTHQELIGNITGSNDFVTTLYPINAGLSSMFVWLSNIAPNYESYKFKTLRFRYEPACATTQVGTIYLTVDFDASDPAPPTEPDLSTYEGTSRGSPWTYHQYNCAPHNLNKRTSYYVRNGPLTGNQDIVLYDVGNLVVATDGNGGTPALGKLWVEYDVEFTTPQLNSNGIGQAKYLRASGTDATTNPANVGNAPIVVTAAGGVVTVTSTSNYQGLISLIANGTGVGSTIGGTATRTALTGFANAPATVFQSTTIATFSRGQTVTFTLSGTLTSYVVRLGQYAYANA